MIREAREMTFSTTAEKEICPIEGKQSEAKSDLNDNIDPREAQRIFFMIYLKTSIFLLCH